MTFKTSKKGSIYCVFLLIVVSIYFLNFGVGGTDLNNYKSQSMIDVIDWDAYQWKEPISWLIVKASYWLAEVVSCISPVFFHVLILLCILKAFTSNDRVHSLMLFLVVITPVGVLLSFNVLRQFSAAIFLFLALYSYLNGRILTFFLMLTVSFFCHNSSIFFITMMIPMVIFRGVGFMFFCVFFGIGIAIVMGLFFGDSGNYSNSIGVSMQLKFLFYWLFLVFCYFILKRFRYNFSLLVGYKGEKVLSYFGLASFVFLLMPVLGVEYWVLNRLLISAVFIVLMFILMGSGRDNKILKWKVVLSMFMVFVSYVHPGVHSMLVG